MRNGDVGMTPADVARRHQFREGFVLVDYAEVGLPVFRLTIEAVTTSYRSIPAIQEFVMRCMSLGEGDEGSIARMLGLKQDLIEGAVNSLVTEGYAARMVIPGTDACFRLTEAGEHRLAEEREEVPQEEMLVIDYDGIRRTPIQLTGQSVVRAGELKQHGAVEIRPYPAEAPSISELPIPEVSRVIRRQGGEEFRRTVLALKRVVRRNNVFREAVALVYAAERGSEIQVAFAIDGQLSEIHERAFAEHGGPRKMGFLKAMADLNGRRRLERLLGKDVVQRLPDVAIMPGLRKAEADAREEVRSILPAVRVQRQSRLNPAVTALKAATERQSVAQHELDTFAIREMAPFEQDELLAEALKNARRSLVVTSAGLSASLVNGYMLRDLDRLTADKVEIDIATFVAPHLESRSADVYDPLVELTKRSKRNALRLMQMKRSDLFFLIQDEELAVVSNRPFLGELGRRTGFQRVEGVVARSREMVERIKDIAISTTEFRSAG